MPDKTDKKPTPASASRFATTHWSVVLAAGKSSSANQKQALETLCRSYWFPLYAFLRRRGYDHHQAEDLVQAFLAHILEKHDLRTADPKYGKFRSFLLIRLKGFLSDERDRARAQKRGGDRKILSLSFQNAEGQYALEPADQLSPEMLFEKSWALTVLERTMDLLEADMAKKHKQKLFEHLKVYLTTEKDVLPYQDTATALDMTEGSIRVAVHRLRRQYRRLLRDEVAQTVDKEDQIDEEMGCLFAALAH
ncbi:MAG: sigma-70 family RNA polymerase sigma factor [Planctomycetes bacterium]|nr:sigma-70 family RNA polymerase sigma factor [Planctomycetota bacterium]